MCGIEIFLKQLVEISLNENLMVKQHQAKANY